MVFAEDKRNPIYCTSIDLGALRNEEFNHGSMTYSSSIVDWFTESEVMRPWRSSTLNQIFNAWLLILEHRPVDRRVSVIVLQENIGPGFHEDFQQLQMAINTSQANGSPLN
jgi:hypothetical protein